MILQHDLLSTQTTLPQVILDKRTALTKGSRCFKQRLMQSSNWIQGSLTKGDLYLVACFRMGVMQVIWIFDTPISTKSTFAASDRIYLFIFCVAWCGISSFDFSYSVKELVYFIVSYRLSMGDVVYFVYWAAHFICVDNVHVITEVHVEALRCHRQHILMNNHYLHSHESLTFGGICWTYCSHHCSKGCRIYWFLQLW